MNGFGFLNYEPESLALTPCRNVMLRLALMMKKRCKEPAVMAMAMGMLTNPKMARTQMKHVLAGTGFYFIAKEGKVMSVAYVLGGQVVVNIATSAHFEGRGHGKELLHEMAARWKMLSTAKLYSPVEESVQEFFQKAGWVFADTKVNADGTRDMVDEGLMRRYLADEATEPGLMKVSGPELMASDYHLWELARETRAALLQRNLDVE